MSRKPRISTVLLYDDTDESFNEGWNDFRKKAINRVINDNIEDINNMLVQGKFKDYNQLADYISDKVYDKPLKELQTEEHSKEQWQPILDAAKELFNYGYGKWLKKNESLKEDLIKFKVTGSYRDTSKKGLNYKKFTKTISAKDKKSVESILKRQYDTDTIKIDSIEEV